MTSGTLDAGPDLLKFFLSLFFFYWQLADIDISRATDDTVDCTIWTLHQVQTRHTIISTGRELHASGSAVQHTQSFSLFFPRCPDANI